VKPAAELRSEVSRLRDALDEADRLERSERIWKRLVELPEFRASSQALFYVSFKSEVDTFLMRKLAAELDKAVAVPRGRQIDKRMTFYYLDRDEELESGPYGILQPPADSERIVELEDSSVVLVPGLVFDLKGNRLGWGAGFYDRFLSGEGRGLPKLGLAFDCQIVDALPAQPHDVPMDAVVTETRVIRP
jgi:5-formyltetrahydrofolate cyclo-ligase